MQHSDNRNSAEIRSVWMQKEFVYPMKDIFRP